VRETLQRRLEQLEQRTMPQSMAIFVAFVHPSGPAVPDPIAVVDQWGWRADRLPGETAEALRTRAAESVPRRTGFVPLFFDVSAEGT
jgi:hypothetical protein